MFLFARPGIKAVPPKQIILSWQTSLLLYIVLELHWKGLRSTGLPRLVFHENQDNMMAGLYLNKDFLFLGNFFGSQDFLVFKGYFNGRGEEEQEECKNQE